MLVDYKANQHQDKQLFERANCSMIYFLAISVCMLLTSSCKKFVEIEAPVTSVNQENVYRNDATAMSVLTSIYGGMSAAGSVFGGLQGISLMTGLSADELSL